MSLLFTLLYLSPLPRTALISSAITNRPGSFIILSTGGSVSVSVSVSIHNTHNTRNVVHELNRVPEIHVLA